MVRVEVAAGGRTIDITEKQETIARELVAKKVGGGTVSLSGHARAIQERYGHLLTIAGQQQHAVDKAFADRRRIREQQATGTKFHGPVSPTTDPVVFRETGRVVTKGSARATQIRKEITTQRKVVQDIVKRQEEKTGKIKNAAIEIQEESRKQKRIEKLERRGEAKIDTTTIIGDGTNIPTSSKSLFPSDIRVTRTDISPTELTSQKFQIQDLFKTTSPQKEFFTPYYEPSTTSGRGTDIARRRTSEELSEQALVYGNILRGDIGASIRFDTEMAQEREKIIERISPDGITEQESVEANLELEEIYKTKLGEYETSATTRAEKITEEVFWEKMGEKSFFPKQQIALTKKTRSVLPEWDFQPEVYESKLEEKGGVTGWKGIPSILTAGGSFVGGVYSGIRDEPVKVVKSVGVATAFTIGTAGLGSAAVSIGYSVKAVSTASKVARVGGLALYGGSVGVRIALTPSTYEKYALAGRITSTELVPFALGGLAGSYGVRRYQSRAELRKYTQMLEPTQKKAFKLQLKEAKKYYSIQPETQELDLSRLKLLEGQPKAQQAVIKFLGQRQLITGGSISQQTQISGVKTKRPGDIDIYVKSLIGEESRSFSYAKDLAKLLKQHKISSVKATKGKVSIGGEKLAEFHPYKTYLRYNIEQVAPLWRTTRSAITTTPSGVKILRVTPQWQRKLVGFYTEPLVSGKQRLKDLPAAKAIRESVIRTARMQEAEQAPQFLSYGKLTINLKTLDPIKIREVREFSKVPTKSSTSQYTPYRASPSSYSPYVPYKRTVSLGYVPKPPIKRSVGYVPSKKTGRYIPSKKIKPSVVSSISSLYEPKEIPTTFVPTKRKKRKQVIPYDPISFKSIVPATYTGGDPKRYKRKPLLIGSGFKPKPRRTKQTFGVQVRRFGKFKPIAKGVSFAKAVEIGRGRVGKTLAATFKLTPEYGKSARGLRTPKGFRRKATKTGIEFIERRRFRLSTRPETKEIQFFQTKKKRKKKGRKK